MIRAQSLREKTPLEKREITSSCHTSEKCYVYDLHCALHIGGTIFDFPMGVSHSWNIVVISSLLDFVFMDKMDEVDDIYCFAGITRHHRHHYGTTLYGMTFQSSSPSFGYIYIGGW